jgi:membrane-associated phospholipid phosphatase
MAGLMVAGVALRRSSGDALRSVLLVAACVVVPIAVLMFLRVRRGHWSNVDASKPSERPALFLVALTGVVAALAWLFVHDPRSFLVRGMFVVAALLLVAALLTGLGLKVSLHAAFAAFAATTLCLLGSPVGYALVAVVPLVCWSRLALARHRVAEVVVGLALGIVAGAVLVLP